MITDIKLEDGRIVIEGPPEGATVHGIKTADAEELVRLTLYSKDLRAAVEWLNAISNEAISGRLREALFIAALIKFCSCFEGTKGARRRPLSVKRIFSPADRRMVTKLRNMRNKMVAHDEQRYAGTFPLIVAHDAEAILACCADFSVVLHSMNEKDDLVRLAMAAEEWVSAVLEETAQRMVVHFNRLPLESRRRLASTAPEFIVHINRMDLH